MEKITSINAERVLWSCLERGIDLYQLAADLQIAERTLREAIETSGGLTFVQLQKLSKYFDRGVLFFLEPGTPQENQLYSPQFRTLANQKPQMTPKVRAIIQRAERQREIYLGLREELGEPALAPFVPTITSSDARDAGVETRSWLKLGMRNTFETYRKAVEANGILVFRTNGYNGAWQIPKTDEIEGFCLYDAACPIIVVKKQDAEPRQVFTLFHELGHLLLHRNSFIDEHKDMGPQNGVEQEANNFAGHLLVPASSLNQINLSEKPANAGDYDEWLRPQRTDWMVSGEVILRRLLEVGKLEKGEYENYRSWKNQQAFSSGSGGSRQYRYREPVHVFGETFARTVLEALARQRITSNKASSYLDNLKINDLRQLETFLATH